MAEQRKELTQDDRREYFRVNDSIRVNLRVVPEDQIDKLHERLDQAAASSFTVMSSMAAISAEMAVSMRRIEQSDPDVATYLKALERKIDVLGRAIAGQESQLTDAPAYPVNLSAGGMGILIDQEFQPGQVLEIRMLLFPSLTGVVTYGTVIACGPADDKEGDTDYRFYLRLAFTHIREQDRDLLIRHALRCQSNALRRSERSEPQEQGQ